MPGKLIVPLTNAVGGVVKKIHQPIEICVENIILECVTINLNTHVQRLLLCVHTSQGPLYWGTSDTPSVDGCQLVSHFGRL